MVAGQVVALPTLEMLLRLTLFIIDRWRADSLLIELLQH